MPHAGSTTWSIPRGVMHLPVACFDANDRLDFDTNAKLIDFQIRHGATSICVPMHLAEQLNLTIEERKDLAKASVDAAGGRVPVLVHVSMPGTEQVTDLVRHAEQIGAAATV